MVTIMIFASERIIGSSATLIVTRKTVFLISCSVDVLIMTFKVRGPGEDRLFAGTRTRKLTGVLALLLMSSTILACFHFSE